MGKKIYEWDGVNPADNNFVASDGGWPEGMLRSDVNNAARENLSDLRQWYDDMDWQKVTVRGPAVADVGSFSRTGDYSFTVSYSDGTTNIASHFDVGRILKFYNSGGASVGDVTQVVSSVYSGSGVTTVTTTASVPKAIDVTAAEVRAFFSREVRLGALVEADQADFFVPETNNSEGIQGAITNAMAAGGGTVLLTAQTYTIDTQIDMTSITSYLTIKGANPEVVLYMDNGANLDSLVHYSNGAQLVSFENLRFNGNRANNPTGNSYGLEVTDNINLTVKDCQFVNLEEGIHFNTDNGTRIIIENCKFFTIEGFGIWTPQSGDHRGNISDCLFSGAALNVANPAMIKIAGRWNIDSNRFLNCGDASITPRAIHLWNESTAEPGGRQCNVTDNTINCENGSLGIGIEVGGDDIVISGNRLVMGVSGTGIYLNGSGAGTTNQRIAVTGNVIRNGASGCTVSDRVRDVVLSGNVVDASDNGMVIQGDDIDVLSNRFATGARGVAVNAAAGNVTLMSNVFRTQTTASILIDGTANQTLIKGNRLFGSPGIGVNIGATTTNTRVFDNYIDTAVSTPVSNASPSTREIGNGVESSAALWKRMGDLGLVNWSSGTTAEEAMTGYTGRDFPTGSNLAYGRWRIWFSIQCTLSANNSQTFRIRIGPNGDITDPVWRTLDMGGTANLANKSEFDSVRWDIDESATPYGDKASPDDNTTSRSSNATMTPAGELVYVCTDARDKVTLTGQDNGGSGTGKSFRVNYFWMEWLGHE